jgi:hypothetical protein
VTVRGPAGRAATGRVVPNAHAESNVRSERTSSNDASARSVVADPPSGGPRGDHGGNEAWDGDLGSNAELEPEDAADEDASDADEDAEEVAPEYKEDALADARSVRGEPSVTVPETSISARPATAPPASRRSATRTTTEARKPLDAHAEASGGSSHVASAPETTRAVADPSASVSVFFSVSERFPRDDTQKGGSGESRATDSSTAVNSHVGPDSRRLASWPRAAKPHPRTETIAPRLASARLGRAATTRASRYRICGYSPEPTRFPRGGARKLAGRLAFVGRFESAAASE